MKTRQFHRLASVSPAARLPLVVQGLEAIGRNVQRIAAQIEACDDAKAYGAARLMHNVGREEAGKFLILLDVYRSPASHPTTVSRQFKRAGNHLAKLIYAEIADYAIASRSELEGAVETLRQELHLDGPNDYDWIFPNELIAEREGALYVDLMDAEGELFWSSLYEDDLPVSVPRPMKLVLALVATGISSAAGLPLLEDAWRDFDPWAQTHYNDWARCSTAALDAFAASNHTEAEWPTAARVAVDLWPMPMVEVDLAEVRRTAEEMAAQREALFDAFLARQYGYDAGDAH
jgi:AbiV family abortive infection protein